MNKYNISAVIPFASYDYPFFKRCIDNLLLLGIECIVVVYDHLYGGEPENTHILNICERWYKNEPLFQMVRLNWTPGHRPIYWEAFARHMGALHSSIGNEYLLFIDIDEIIDPIEMDKWLSKKKYRRYRGIKLNCYMYDRKPTLQLKKPHYNTILCKKWYALSLGFKPEARLQFFNNKNKISRWLAKLRLNPIFYIYRGKPFIHHYTGYRNNMDKKLNNWSHCDDPKIVKAIIESRYESIDSLLKKVNVVENKFNL